MGHGNGARAKVRQAFLPVCLWRRTAAGDGGLHILTPRSLGMSRNRSWSPRSPRALFELIDSWTSKRRG